MMEHDQFSRWLGIRVLAVQEGYAKIEMVLREEMLNGFGIIHGGITFSLADSAFAFACNNRNNLSVALDTTSPLPKQQNQVIYSLPKPKSCITDAARDYTWLLSPTIITSR
jgi:hypothetical protein